MALEYIVGPVLALLLGMKFTDFKTKEKDAKIVELESKIALIETETPKKMMATLMPVAKAVQKLNSNLQIKIRPLQQTKRQVFKAATLIQGRGLFRCTIMRNYQLQWL